MLIASMLGLADVNTFDAPGYFVPVFVGMLLLGLVAWLIASVLGFARARAFGPATRWFSLAAVCLLLFHIQIIVAGFGVISLDKSISMALVAFLDLFVVLGAVCAIIGFVRLTSPR
ncbi:MAG TPA: hypothetical protein VGN90_00660 [Pyrinomonadaceae bacterium]|jgi:uncharacterized membrane protein YhdT|nr:hypothetical protein [Pyrinomonadaceae bacterium]